MNRIIIRLLINGIALWVAAELIEGIQVEGGWQVLAAMALIFGLVNALIRPFIKLLTCPLVILTLGLFTLVINAAMLLLSAWIGDQFGLGFRVDGWWPALLGSLLISIVSAVLSVVLRDER